MAVDALGPVPFQPTDVDVKRKIPFHDLKVPQQYRLMGYKGHNVHDAWGNYVPVGLMRELRSGAEDEVINLAPSKLHILGQGDSMQDLEVKVQEVVEPIEEVKDASTHLASTNIASSFDEPLTVNNFKIINLTD